MAGELICPQCHVMPTANPGQPCDMCDVYNELTDSEEADTPIFIEPDSASGKMPEPGTLPM